MFDRKALLILAALAASAPAAARKVQLPADTAPSEVARLYFTEDPDAPRHAPPGYDFTIVEYLDYQCPYCRAAHDTLRHLMKSDRKVRVIFRDLPVFGPASERAARVAIAAKYQDKYLAVHAALLAASRPLDDKKIEAAARKAGANWTRLQADLKRHSGDIDDLIERNRIQSEMLGFTGTPGFIIGTTLGFGAIKLAPMQKVIAETRAKQAKSERGR
ncbi:MAG: DsbA family protein [Sphingomicrobium sp.]